MWKVTIDQIAEQGGTQRYEHTSAESRLEDAVVEALERHRLTCAEVGQYQITVTPR